MRKTHGTTMRKTYGITKTNGKYNSRAVMAFHMDTVSNGRAHCMGRFAGVLYQPEHEKTMMRNALAAARAARLADGIYKPGEFHEARLV